jgi:hypothetical protein
MPYELTSPAQLSLPYLGVEVTLKDADNNPVNSGSPFFGFFIGPNENLSVTLPNYSSPSPADPTGTLGVAILDAITTAVEGYDWTTNFSGQWSGFTTPISVSTVKVYEISVASTDVTPS